MAAVGLVGALGSGVSAAAAQRPGTTEQGQSPVFVQASRTAPACAVPAPTSAVGYQAMFDAKDDASWAGGDQATSLALPDGRVLWLFGDTLRRTAAGPPLVHNAMLVQTGGCLEAVPAAAEVIPSVSDSEWFWPQDAVVVGEELVVFVARVRRTGPGPMDFAAVGVDAARFSLAGSTPAFEGLMATPSSQVPETGAQYGRAVVQIGPWLYVYGSRKVPGAFGKAVTVARVRPGRLLDPTAWRWWTASGWSSDQGAAQPLATDWSTSFSVWRSGPGLRMLTKRDDVYGHDLLSGAAPGPTHPFSRTVVGQAPSGQRPGELLYNALAHPELPLGGGHLLVTVCRNNLSLQQVWTTKGLYKPQFREIDPTSADPR